MLIGPVAHGKLCCGFGLENTCDEPPLCLVLRLVLLDLLPPLLDLDLNFLHGLHLHLHFFNCFLHFFLQVLEHNFLHNLQIITRQQNSRKIKYNNKKNGLPKGVSCNKNKTKFYANIIIGGTKCYLGCADNVIDAHDIYMKKYTELMIGVLNP